MSLRVLTKRSLIIGMCLLFLSSCGGREFVTQKSLVLSGKDLQAKGSIPVNAFYDQQYEKSAVVFRSVAGKELLAFYDLTGGPPVFYFETPYADEVAAPRHAKNLNMAYALREGVVWNIFLRTVVAPEPVKILTLKTLLNFVLEEKNLRIYTLTKDASGYAITPSPFKEWPHYKHIEEFSLDRNQKLIFKALKADGLSWVAYAGNQESEQFTFISKFAFTKEGQLAYIARSGEDKWFSIVGAKKTPLAANYQEIGQVYVANGEIVFSGVRKGSSTWEIASHNRILAKEIAAVPEFIVGDDGEIIYIETGDQGSRVISEGKQLTDYFSQIDQIVSSNGNLFAKIKNKFSLWQVISGEVKSDQYVWMSDMFLDSKGDVFFLGLTSIGDVEFFKFHHK